MKIAYVTNKKLWHRLVENYDLIDIQIYPAIYNSKKKKKKTDKFYNVGIFLLL